METKAEKITELSSIISNKSERIKKLKLECGQQATKICVFNLRVEALESALQRIDNWAKAYPIKAFPEPDFEKAAKVLKAAGQTLDAISASNMRYVLNRVKGIVEQALKPRT